MSYDYQRKTRKTPTQEEFKKAKAPTFDGEIKKSEEEEALFLGTNKYFKWWLFLF